MWVWRYFWRHFTLTYKETAFKNVLNIHIFHFSVNLIYWYSQEVKQIPKLFLIFWYGFKKLYANIMCNRILGYLLHFKLIEI